MMLIVGVIGLFNVAYAGGQIMRCPRCGTPTAWSGRTEVDAYGVYYIYECINGHVFASR